MKKTLDRTKFMWYNIEDIQSGDIVINPRDSLDYLKVKKIFITRNLKTWEKEFCVHGKALSHLKNEDGFRMFYLNQGSSINKYEV